VHNVSGTRKSTFDRYNRSTLGRDNAILFNFRTSRTIWLTLLIRTAEFRIIYDLFRIKSRSVLLDYPYKRK